MSSFAVFLISAVILKAQVKVILKFECSVPFQFLQFFTVLAALSLECPKNLHVSSIDVLGSLDVGRESSRQDWHGGPWRLGCLGLRNLWLWRLG